MGGVSPAGVPGKLAILGLLRPSCVIHREEVLVRKIGLSSVLIALSINTRGPFRTMSIPALSKYALGIGGLLIRHSYSAELLLRREPNSWKDSIF